MSTYLIQFGIYTMAMVGAIFLCLIVFKKTMVNSRCTGNDSELKIENALNLSQRKTLYVIKAGDEKFLIAADAERTTFLSKLNMDTEEVVTSITQKDEPAPILPEKSKKIVDYTDVMNSVNKSKGPVLKEMLRKLNTAALYKETI